MSRFLKTFLIFLVIASVATAAVVFFRKCPRRKKIDLSVVGYINMSDGLGRQGPELLRAFRKEINTNFRITRKVKGGENPRGFERYIAKKKDRWGKVIVFEDILWEPYGQNYTDILNSSPSKSIKLAYSMWESTRIPQEWVDTLNSRFDAVLVPSEFLVETYQVSGVNIPIFVVPLALEFRHFFNQPLKDKSQETFVFGNFSAGTDRKNHVNLIRAFHRAFGDDPSVQLVLNARYCEKEVRNAITRELALIDAKNIKFTQGALSKDSYLQKFQGIDCYVSPSKGEGFSIQPREAMALGIPVIATNNTGQTDICKTGLVRAVNTPIPELAVNPWGDCYGNNFNCEVDDLAQAMRDVREEYSSYLAKSESAREWAREFLFSSLKDLYASLITPKKVRLGLENKVTPEYIMTESLDLFFKYKKAFGQDICEADNENIFTFIYESGEWGRNEDGEGYSGAGSRPEHAASYMDLLTSFLKEHQIRSVVDLGCGDWTFSKHMDWSGVDYTGIDVVKFVIDRNNELYRAPNIQFIHADGTELDLPEADLLVCKDVMQHLSNGNVASLLKQLKKYKHCLITNDIETSWGDRKNRNIQSGACRCLDLRNAPFNLKAEPLLEYDAEGTRKLVLHVDGSAS